MNLARSSFYLTVTNISLSCITSLNFFFLAAALSPKQLGILSILLTIPSVGLCLLSVGYNKAALYYIGRKIFSLETIIVNGIIICLLLEVIIAILLRMFQSYKTFLFADISFDLFCLAALSTPIQVFLYYLTDACLAADKIAITIWARSFSPIVYVTGCVIAGLSGDLSAGTAFAFYVLGMLLANLTALAQVVFRSQDKKLFKPNFYAAITCLRFGWKAQIGELAQYLAIRLDLILVGFWAGMEASGYYSVATRLAETISLVAYSAQLALSAKVAQRFLETPYNKGRRLERAVRYMATVSFLLSGGIIIASFIVFNFFLARYWPSFYLLLTLTPGQIALAIFLLMIANLIGDGHPILATKLQVLLFFFSLIAYLSIIPSLGAIGAGLATSAAYVISVIITAVILARKYQIRLLDFLLLKRADIRYFNLSKKYLSRYFSA